MTEREKILNSIYAAWDEVNEQLPDDQQLEKSPDQSDYCRQYITVTVADQGGGISEENLANIFNPFFTTKDCGTGLGLSISHNIIKAHQGTIDVENEDSKGACFIIKIPYWDHELDKK